MRQIDGKQARFSIEIYGLTEHISFEDDICIRTVVGSARDRSDGPTNDPPSRGPRRRLRSLPAALQFPSRPVVRFRSDGRTNEESLFFFCGIHLTHIHSHNMTSEIGLAGLGVMGRNLALNIADHGGFAISVLSKHKYNERERET